MNIEQVEHLKVVREQLNLKPLEMAAVMGANYDTFKDWQSGRRNMTSTSLRCIDLLLAVKGTTIGRKFGV